MFNNKYTFKKIGNRTLCKKKGHYIGWPPSIHPYSFILCAKNKGTRWSLKEDFHSLNMIIKKAFSLIPQWQIKHNKHVQMNLTSRTKQIHADINCLFITIPG